MSEIELKQFIYDKKISGVIFGQGCEYTYATFRIEKGNIVTEFFVHASGVASPTLIGGTKLLGQHFDSFVKVIPYGFVMVGEVYASHHKLKTMLKDFSDAGVDRIVDAIKSINYDYDSMGEADKTANGLLAETHLLGSSGLTDELDYYFYSISGKTTGTLDDFFTKKLVEAIIFKVRSNNLKLGSLIYSNKAVKIRVVGNQLFYYGYTVGVEIYGKEKRKYFVTKSGNKCILI